MDRQGNLRAINAGLPLGSDLASVRQRLEALERLLEASIEVPGLDRRIGLDALLGLVPVVGDLVTADLGLYFVWEARNLGLPRWQLWRMAGNVGFDTLLGAVPVAGDLFDFLYRSNTHNLRILRKHLDKHHPHTRLIEG
jgi:hypothetical protein